MSGKKRDNSVSVDASEREQPIEYVVSENNLSVKSEQTERTYKKYTVDEVDKALRENRGLITNAAKALGASRTTISQMVGDTPQLQEAIRAAREATIDVAHTHHAVHTFHISIAIQSCFLVMW